MLEAKELPIKQIEVSKEYIKDVTNAILQSVKEGYANALETKIKLKVLENVIKETFSILDSLARSEAEKHGEKTFEMLGAKVELAETGTKYDYAGCGDVIYARLVQESEALQAKIKEREAILKAIKTTAHMVDEQTGEMFQVTAPVKSSTSSIKITIK